RLPHRRLARRSRVQFYVTLNRPPIPDWLSSGTVALYQPGLVNFTLRIALPCPGPMYLESTPLISNLWKSASVFVMLKTTSVPRLTLVGENRILPGYSGYGCPV